MIYLAMRHHIRVIQVNGFFESILLIPARLLGRRTVYTRHGPFEIDLFPWYRMPHKYIPRLLSRYLGQLASQVVCVSETVGSLYEPLFRSGKVAVIPNWVTRLPTRELPRLHEREITHILCVGRLEKYKGVQLLIEAVRGLGRVQLTIVGEGVFRRELEKLAAGQPVRFAGFQKDPFPFYRKADIFVMPSLGPEGLPMVSLEAMSHMLPCIFSDLPVHAEITNDGDAALLFRCGDASDLRAKLLHLIECPAERARLAQNANLVIQEKYNESVAREAYLKAFAIAPLTHLDPVAYKGVP
jgi:glycosyltransferase involved in cell wall biosynthesis